MKFHITLPILLFCWLSLLSSATYTYDVKALRVYKADQLGNISTPLNNLTTHFARDLSGSVIASYENTTLRYHGLLGPDGSLIGQADGTNGIIS